MEPVSEAATVAALAAIPGLVHGFGRRAAGSETRRVSPSEPYETREETARRVRATLDGSGRLLLLHQVHGARVVEAPWDDPPEADAAVTASPGLLVGIQTADCLPLLLVDQRRRTAAAAHAGWRGTAKGIAREAVAALVARGARPAELTAALGPGIGACCYEVGDDVRAAFAEGGGAFFRPGPHGRAHLDVRAANRAQLLAAGLRPEAVHDVDECTRCRPDLYHSYRREGKGGGRMISYIGFR